MITLKLAGYSDSDLIVLDYLLKIAIKESEKFHGCQNQARDDLKRASDYRSRQLTVRTKGECG